MEPKYNDEDMKNHDAVAAVIKNDEGMILMQKHNKYGFWTIPIGKAGKGQSPEDGLKQEIFEECGLIIEESDLIKQRDYEYIRNQKDIRLTLFLYEITKSSGVLENKEPHKHAEQKFVSIDKIAELPYLSDATILFLESIGIIREARI
ncbi:MAG: NUDIX hydrolase [Nanoarchaeota archaeon]|jgi:8-oxo-dGTP pyrophosphatase MutT (NUDIX family)|nr:NUDIX hydrolase [Nanoarchaeota archaeon]